MKGLKSRHDSPPPRLWRPALATLATLFGLAALGAFAEQARALTFSEYCDPAATDYDPPDVPPEGSIPLSAPVVKYRDTVLADIPNRLLEAGPRNATTAAVFLHGSPGSGSQWAQVVSRLGQAGIRAVAFEMPGYGHAGDVWGRAQTADSGSDYLDAALAELGISRVHLVMHDFAGVVGLEWAIRKPNRMRSATLLNTGALLSYRHHALARLTRSAEGVDFWSSVRRPLFAAAVQDGQTRPLPDDFIDDMYADLDRETRCTILRLYRSTRASQVRKLARRQARILSQWPERPALIIRGANDPYVPVELARQQRQAFPSARVEIFASTGHWPFVDRRARTRRLVVPFIRRSVRADRRG